ncbi:hypothetical protein [Marinivivus vitaminiproducens]|uniref:hypothetical protein n=1 Tax=Marinivivus vitaminiproducens TaxID=3035935 RepID=UPI0027998707|nr:hypothetical protein P4R82_18400 [Geminicoccaceae bacterium SCSIO 64248]
MAFFDLPGPFFSQLDTLLDATIPPSVRLVLWAIAAAAVSMGLYRAISPQGRIAQAQAEVVEARRVLNGFDGEFADAWPLMKRMLGASLRHVGLVTGPAIAASLPVLFLLVWLSTAFGYVFPGDDDLVDVRVEPTNHAAVWVGPGQSPDGPRVQVREPENDAVLADLPLAAPVTVLHKRQWWNTLVGNPAGYLPDEVPLDRIEIGLPRQEVLSFGPAWLRSWEALFFTALVLSSLAIKLVFRIR